MATRVKNRTLYHFSQVKPYKQAFVHDQCIKVGEDLNPFFAFYERVREYPVTMGGGAVVQLKAVHFLDQVRQGRVQHLELAKIAVEVARHYVMLARELVMEEIRLKEFRGAPSRQRCLYACETLEDARYWMRRVGGEGTICSLRCTGKIHRGDAGLLLADSEPLSVTRDRARMYWRGETSEKPEWETLFTGEAVVTGVSL